MSTIFLVQCPEIADGVLIVTAESPKWAAEALQREFFNQYPEDDTDGRFAGTYHVNQIVSDLGGGIWLSGYDRSDDHLALLAVPPMPPWMRSPSLWGPEILVVLQ